MSGSLGTFGGLQPTVTREGPIYNVKVDTAESGIEVRTIYGTTPRYRYNVEIVLQGSLGEISTVVNLINANYGQGDHFTMTDPVTNGTVTVRMDGNLKLSQHQGIAGWWKASMTTITVI